MLIDTHAHLLHAKYAEEPVVGPEQLIGDARAAGVGAVVCIACRRGEWAPTLALARQNPAVWVGAGVHPYDAEELPTEAELQALAQHPRVVGLGETGLDYSAHNTAPRDVQAAMFERHVQVAQAAGLPVIVHTRDAEADTLAILQKFAGVHFVLHCFTGTRAMAMAGVEMGGYISFSGILTFKKSDDLRALAAELPRDRVLVETDAPYLAPEPVRGRRCTPAYTAHTAACLAKVWGVSDSTVAEITTANARRLFARLVGA